MPTDDPRSDEELVAAANHGDESALAAIYLRYRDWVVRLARRLTGSDDDALDVLQEAFSYVCRKFPGFHLSASMTTFLYPVVKNVAIAVRRKRGRMMLGADEWMADLPGPIAESGTDRAELAIVLAALPEGQREVVLMRFVDAMSLEEIGTALGLPVGTVKSRLHNAIATLRSDPRARRYLQP